ncbi:PREDICTED: uncharacterized protein LOC109338567 [Lupinus angustifolius]|uniref:uncharacterized protein LOC109338567 n=1 Tax=Lupinus angustifolius TaxID=3871 RepID=UPI00092EB5F2|nr:PREDICTED: uncharacterized protein LOC109338567 [Lupinus angustifolius]
MQNCNPVMISAEGSVKQDDSTIQKSVDATLFRKMVGCLGFVCHSRPELGYSAGVISRHMANPNQTHMTTAKKIMRYLKGTLSYGIMFPNQRKEDELQLVGCSDSDWCGDKEDRRSTPRYTFFISGSSISWSPKKQELVALSTCEAKYIAACNAACQGL